MKEASKKIKRSKTEKDKSMEYDGRFIMQKTVDWSLLNDGMTIPVSACTLLKAWDESILTHGITALPC